MYEQTEIVESGSGVNELIVVRQLPVIEEQLRQLKAGIEQRVGYALTATCTEQTRTSVKKLRADLRKEFDELESRRKYVKAAIMEPYMAFEATYNECVASLYKSADQELAERIAAVENQLKQEKAEIVKAYFDEYRQSLGIDAGLVSFEMAGIKITLSASDKSLANNAKEFLDRIAGDLAAIELQEFKDEIMAEYKHTLNFSAAVRAVEMRHKAIEAERLRREQAEAERMRAEEAASRVDEAVAQATVEEVAPAAPPTIVANPEPVQDVPAQRFKTVFSVEGTIEQIRALKKFLNDEEYTYSCTQKLLNDGGSTYEQC